MLSSQTDTSKALARNTYSYQRLSKVSDTFPRELEGKYPNQINDGDPQTSGGIYGHRATRSSLAATYAS